MPIPAPKCRRCAWTPDGQVFRADGYEYSVAAARAILRRRPRTPITLPSGHMYERLRACALDLRHVEHVNIRFPVIAIPYADSFLIIDGNHRVWKRLFRKLPIRAYLLTLEEANEIRTEKP